MAITLLNTKPSFEQVCNALLNHFNTGDDFISCIDVAHAGYWDSAYAGSKDRLSNFGKYGEPTSSTNPTAQTWEYDETNVKTFQATCNHSKWKFTTESVVTGFVVQVYDSTNESYLGDFDTTSLWDSGCIVRVNPSANNTGESNKNCLLSIGTYDDLNIVGGSFTGVQYYEGGDTPPEFYGSCGDETFTLSAFSCSVGIGDESAYIIYSPAGYSGSNYTIYWFIMRGAVQVGYDQVTNNINGSQRTKTIALSEPAIAGETYNVIGYTIVS